MRKRMQKFLLVLVAVALAAAPLRGAFAMPVPAAPGEADHCARLQAGMTPMDHVASRHETGTGQPDHGCGHGCGGDCCNGKCGTCAHASVALPGATTGAADRYSGFLSVPVVHHFAGRTTHPPFRPPIVFS